MDTMDHVTQGMVPGTHLVDILPLRKGCSMYRSHPEAETIAVRVFPQWLPGTSRHFGAKGRTLVDNMVGDPFRHVQKQMVGLDIILSMPLADFLPERGHCNSVRCFGPVT
jgi:hypothetical protein